MSRSAAGRRGSTLRLTYLSAGHMNLFQPIGLPASPAQLTDAEMAALDAEIEELGLKRVRGLGSERFLVYEM